MKTSILQLLNETPLRVLAPQEAKPAADYRAPEYSTAVNAPAAEPHTLRPLLLSLLLVLTAYYVFLQFVG